jgi:diaminopimelate decarboxylase
VKSVSNKLDLFPASTSVDTSGSLVVGGCSLPDLAEEYGTPLYVYDEVALRAVCRAYQRALERHYPGEAHVAYAGKAYLNLALAQLYSQEGLNLDVVSSGELYVAQKAGFPASRIEFHGNNKTDAELQHAIRAGVGRIVVDNFRELDALQRLAAAFGKTMSVWLRLSPGVDAHTHEHRKTGLLDSKFGFPIATGAAERALSLTMASTNLELVGLHAHIGSQIGEVEPFVQTVERVLAFAGVMQESHGFRLSEFSPGGGWGIRHREEDLSVPVDRYVQAVGEATQRSCERHGLELPALIIEPGRSIVGPAGVALYRVGARKEIPGVRTYVAVDGGMADNIRPALYQAAYTAVVANKANYGAEEVVTIAGRFCESGDVLIRDVPVPHLGPGDLVAVPNAGAYCLAMASNYNLVGRPAVIMVNGGKSRLIQRRETLEDLVSRDFPLT